MSNLIKHAEFELKLAKLDKSETYGDLIYISMIELISKFSKQNHSGCSAAIVIELFNKLASYENLEPLGITPDEWQEASKGVWQNRRASHIFSEDEGNTWYSVNDPDRKIIGRKKLNPNKEIL